jgi:hypothetical protein
LEPPNRDDPFDLCITKSVSFHLPVKHRDNRPGIPPPILQSLQIDSVAAFAMRSAFQQTLHDETLLQHRRSFV